MDYIFFTVLLLLLSAGYSSLVAYKLIQYNKRKTKCTKIIDVKVERFDMSTERMYRSEAITWYIHTFSNLDNPKIKYYNRNSKSYGFETPEKTTQILINPNSPTEFFYPKEAEPRKQDGIACGILSAMLFIALIFELTHLDLFIK